MIPSVSDSLTGHAAREGVITVLLNQECGVPWGGGLLVLFSWRSVRSGSGCGLLLCLGFESPWLLSVQARLLLLIVLLVRRRVIVCSILGNRLSLVCLVKCGGPRVTLLMIKRGFVCSVLGLRACLLLSGRGKKGLLRGSGFGCVLLLGLGLMVLVVCVGLVCCGIMRTIVGYCGAWEMYERDGGEALPRTCSLRQGDLRRSKAVPKLQPLLHAAGCYLGIIS
jgi:hypothetical protein